MMTTTRLQDEALGVASLDGGRGGVAEDVLFAWSEDARVSGRSAGCQGGAARQTGAAREVQTVDCFTHIHSLLFCLNPSAVAAPLLEIKGAPVYHPRAVILDVSGATGGVSFGRDAPLANAGAAPAAGTPGTWGGGVELHAARAVPKSAFTRELEAQARVDLDAAPAAAAARLQAQLEAAARALDGGADAGDVAAALAAGIGGGNGGGDSTAASTSGGGGGGGASTSGGVRYWTDYLKTQLHPRSVLALPGAWHGDAATRGALAGYGAAEALSHGVRASAEAAADAARWWCEQCDSLQGVQVLADGATAFGGVARALLDALAEELPGARVLFFSLRDEQEQAQQQSGLAAAAAAAAAGGGGRGGANAREALSDALAAAELSERSAVYFPLCAPAAAARALPLLRWPPGWARSPYWRGALLAAALDTATLPLRLAGAASALEAPRGAADVHSWAQLLTAGGGGGGSNFAAMALQLPAGAADTDEWRRSRERDARQQQTHGSGSGGGGGGGGSGATGTGGAAGPAGAYGLSTVRGAAILVPGPAAPAMAPQASVAESIVLRGARTPALGGSGGDGGGSGGSGSSDSRACSVDEAAAALDGALLAEPRRRCIVHRCVSPAALAVPLPFPGLFGPGLDRSGGVVAGWSPERQRAAALAAGAGGDGRHVASCPVLARVAASRDFEPWLAARAAGLRRAASSGAGRALAEAWGYGAGDLAEAEERLRALAGAYSAADSDDGLDG